jgi:hypothetical protein
MFDGSRRPIAPGRWFWGRGTRGHVRREAVELFEPSVERGGERRGENEVIADGIALLDRVRLLDHVLRTDGQETAEPQRILDRRKFSRYHPARPDLNS